jgi:hypothetical protein
VIPASELVYGFIIIRYSDDGRFAATLSGDKDRRDAGHGVSEQGTGETGEVQVRAGGPSINTCFATRNSASLSLMHRDSLPVSKAHSLGGF